jgi:hypothetical protein
MFELSNRGMFDRGEHTCRHDPIYNGRAKCGFGVFRPVVEKQGRMPSDGSGQNEEMTVQNDSLG